MRKSNEIKKEVLERKILDFVWIKNKKNVKVRLIKKVFKNPLRYMKQKQVNKYFSGCFTKPLQRRVFSGFNVRDLFCITPLEPDLSKKLCSVEPLSLPNGGLKIE